jgi:hypothetical protein
MASCRWHALPVRYAGLAGDLGLPVHRAHAKRRAMPAEPLEYDHQVALIERCAAHAGRYPGLHLINASANGGLRKRGVAGQLKAMGVRDGFPDLNLPVARGNFHSLYIELKRPRTGRPSESQLWWQAELRAQGHRAEIAYGEDAAWAVIEAYYALPTPAHMTRPETLESRPSFL